MKKTFIIFLLVFSGVWGQHYQTDFPPSEFKSRWDGVFSQIGNNSVAIVQGFPLSNGFKGANPSTSTAVSQGL